MKLNYSEKLKLIRESKNILTLLNIMAISKYKFNNNKEII